MTRMLIPLAILLLLVGAGVAAWVMRPEGDEGRSTYRVRQVSELPQGVTEEDALPLNETLLAAFPPAAREAFLRAAREGSAEFEMGWDERDRLYALFDDARREMGRGLEGYYRLEGRVLRMSAAVGHG